jgi:hypothetical protein
MPAAAEARPRWPACGRDPESALGDEALVAVGAGEREDPAIVGTPQRAVSAEHRITGAAWSTRAYAFITVVYGKQIIRLSSVTVVISSGSRTWGDHAYGFVAATRE